MRRPPSIGSIKLFLFLSVLLTIGITVGVFAYFFHENTFGQPRDFSDFANYFSGISGPILAFLSSLMIVFTIWHQSYQFDHVKLKTERIEKKNNLENYINRLENEMKNTIFIHQSHGKKCRKISLKNLLDPLYALEYGPHIGYLEKCSKLIQSPEIAPDDFDEYSRLQLIEIIGSLNLACIAYAEYIETSPSEIESRVFYEKLYKYFAAFKTSDLLYTDQVENISNLLNYSGPSNN